MIYVRVEDSTDGFKLCKDICDIYFKQAYNIESLNGIIDVGSKIEELLDSTNNEDKILIVYDNITENPLVRDNIANLYDVIDSKDAWERIRMVDTLSFELEILFIDDINIITDGVYYNNYIRQIKNNYNMNRNTRQLTLLTKVDIKYRELYDKIRKRKYNRGPYKGMNADELELHITIESLAKELLKGLFREQIIDKPMTKCWEVPCCYRTRDICHPPLLDVRKIIKAQETDINTKKNILISNTSYQNILDNTTLINRYKLVDFVNEQILESSYINNKSKED